VSTTSLPENVIPISTRQDAIDTAQAFHAELDDAERGQSTDMIKARWSSKLFGRSRFRRARIFDGLAVALLMALMAALGTVVYAASAKADTNPDPQAVSWAAHNEGAVCATIADYPSTNGLLGIMEAAAEQGLTAPQAGEAVAMSIYDGCPRYSYIIDIFVAKYGAKSSVA